MAVREPIAIVGMACRFPGGASSLERFWKLLETGTDAICDVPKNRWDSRKFYSPVAEKAGKAYVNQAGFLQEPIDEFDPLFFRMSPRETESLDPQQRILLEVAWESLEDAGVQLERLEGSDTGVFVGGFCLDANHLHLSQMNRNIIDSHTATSSSMAILANRVSYVFNLQGPSVSMDTACSSSLVATHMACQSLWNGECSMAIAGGTNVMLRPETPITMSKGKFLSPSGRCMTFDKRANGYVRAEGAGTVILKPLSRAIADKDRIYAQILATGINQDGRTNGITFPNGESQKALMRRVYELAGIQPNEIDYIEAHGTGTQAGDVTEAGALHDVLSLDRPMANKVIVGSVKTNIGHLEAGAGIAGVIKTALCMHKRTIVPNLHFVDPNPEIPFGENCIHVPTDCMPWPAHKDKPRLAAINSFGYGGTNAHVLLQEAPAPAGPTNAAGEHAVQEALVCLSANGESALNEMARKYVNWLAASNGSLDFRDMTYSLNQRRSHLDNRLAIRARSTRELQEKLKAFAKDGFSPDLVSGQVDPGPVVFVYTGMGPQWWGMGRDLYASEPVFADTMRDCDQIFQEIAGWSILEEMLKPESESRITETQIAQPANFVIQAALTALWAHWGVTPQAVVGHSVGEVAAAYVSGALSLRDALTVSYHRSRLQATLAGTGAMLAAGLNERKALEYAFQSNKDRVTQSIAAFNGPNSVTLAGDTDVLKSLADRLEKDGVFAQFLKVEVPYHSHLMDSIENELLDSLKGLVPGPTAIPLYSTITGQCIAGEDLSNAYWWRNVRQTVRFSETMAALLDASYRHFVEVGPHPVLKPSIVECLSAAGKKGYTVQTLNRKETAERNTVIASLSTLHTLGIPIDLSKWTAPGGKLIDLPAYPWQKARYWRESQASRQDRLGTPGPAWFQNDLRLHHPAWEVEFSPGFFPFVEDHVVQGNVVFPGAAYVEAGLQLNRKLSGQDSCILENVSFQNMLPLLPEKVQHIQLHYQPDSRYYAVWSAMADDERHWTLHAKGRIVSQDMLRLMNRHEFAQLRIDCPEELHVEEQYRKLAENGLTYGPAFRTITDWRRGKGQVLVRLVQPEHPDSALEPSPLHPTLLDGAFQSLVALFDSDGAESRSFVPVEIRKLALYAPVQQRCWAYGRITSESGSVIEGDIDLLNDAGDVLVALTGVKCRAIAGRSHQTPLEECRYHIEWVSAELEPGKVTRDHSKEPWLILGNSSVAAGWSLVFKNAGIDHTVVHHSTVDVPENGALHIDLTRPEEVDKLFAGHASRNILYLLHLDKDAPSTASQEIVHDLWPLTLMVRAARSAALKSLRIAAVTPPVHALDGHMGELQLTGAALHSMLPLISNEYSEVTVCAIDADEASPKTSVLLDIVSESRETAVAWRGGKRYLKRLERIPEDLASAADESLVATSDANVELLISRPGSLDSLEYIEKARRAPEPDEIEIQVYASSLNFKDLLKVYGQIADNVIEDTYFGNSLGMELSGVVTRVGANITEYKVGDAVAGPIRGSFCAYATVPTTYVIHKPTTLTFNETPVYIGYLAAYRGLVHCADLQAGEKILIHNATGGVGVAALQIARWKGAEIYATAGTSEKRDFLRDWGVQHIYDSRSLLFTEEILRDTGGYGVDVVINAIAGEALYKSMNLLAPYGRFIEIGKRDIGEDNGLPLRAFNRNLTFTAVDMDRMLCDRVAIVQQILRDISENFEKGIFEPVPVSIFKASAARDAFSAMAQSKHMGKVVLEFINDTIPVRKATQETPLFNARSAYAVTGGTSGFGLVVARWMAENGAGRVLLLSRSGIKTDAEQTLYDQLARTADVRIEKLDITDAAQVDTHIARLRQSDMPLRGILHSAMVLDDGFLKDMTPERYARVLAPKVDGAWNLHHATKDDALDFFVLFSSIASLVGNAGQANYVAANGFLDAFAQYRRSLGLPALTINWGVLGEAGVVARNQDVGTVLELTGMKPFTNTQALNSLAWALRKGSAQTGLFDIDWQRVTSAYPALAQSGMFRALVASAGSGAGNNKVRAELLEVLLPMAQEERQQEIEARLLERISAILKIPANLIDARKNMADLGIDSLVAVELTVALQKSLAVEISTVDLLGKPTVGELAAMILGQIVSDEDELLANIDNLSEEDLDRLLDENAGLTAAE